MTQNGKNNNEKQITQNQLNECPLFTNWTQADKALLAQSAKEFNWSPGETLFERGDPVKWLYLIITGSVKGVVFTEKGEEAIIDVGSNGRWFGGLGIVDQRPHQHTAIALEAVRCIGYDGEVIRRIIETNPALYREITILLCDRLRATYLWIEESLLSPVRKRIFNHMKQIAMDMGASHEDGFIIRTRMSQDLLAAMLGVTRQTLNKEMSELKKSGMIKKIGSHYWVKCSALDQQLLTTSP